MGQESFSSLKSETRMRKWDFLATIIAWICAAFLALAVMAIVGYVILHGIGSFESELIFGQVPFKDAILMRKAVTDGLYPAIVGTFFVVMLSMTFAIPVGVSAGIYMAEYAPKEIKKVFDLFFDILSGIPSVVIGLSGFSITVIVHRYYPNSIQPCLFISSLSLSFLVLPYIIRTVQTSLETVPLSTRLIALSFGASKFQNLIHVLLPQSLAGILSGIILATARCAEDTAVIMLTGAVAMAGIPTSIFSKYEALPFYIYYISAQYRDNEELMRGYGACIILLIVCLLLFLLSFLLKRSLTYVCLYKT